MSWYDLDEKGFWSGTKAAVALGAAQKIPGVANVLNGAEAIYHGGAAIYDGVTGDRDGAVDHGTQAIYNAVGVAPGLAEVTSALDFATTAEAELVGKPIVRGAGGDVNQVPTDAGQAFGDAAVGYVNALFGEDDSNLIAAGDAPQGDRQGEVGAGYAGIGQVLGGMMGQSAIPPLAAHLAPVIGSLGGDLGNRFGRWLGDNEAGKPTSGAKPGFMAREGARIHDEGPKREHLGPMAGDEKAGDALRDWFSENIYSLDD